jgi:hypothetical protein
MELTGVDMKQTTQRFTFLALIALLTLFAGCKGESPTAPPPITTGGGTGTGSGGTQPPVGATVVLTATTLAPFTGSTSTITATVTLNNAPVPNGTAVEFSTATTNAAFTDTSDNPTTLIRTTTAGVAKATVTSATAGPVIVTVTVNNVTKNITLNFQDPTVPPTPPSTAPTITSITPTSGLPTGNQQVIITGTNFRVPVRVLFDPGAGQPVKEAFATSVTPTQITVITPAFDLGVSQQLVVGVTVIVEAGTATEQRVTKASAFTYTAAVLTPVVRAVSPTSGPIDGGTRVTITGDAFEAPLQVFFGAAQAQVLSVSFHSIDVMSPTARDTNSSGTGPVLGPVDIKILNVNSGKSTVATGGFRYVNKAQITAITPDQGPFTGGTRVLIDGTGFNEPVTVFLDGIAASVIKVTPTEITAISNGIAIASCADSTGPVIVTNVDNGDSATAPVGWIYRVAKPAIIGVSPSSVAPGGNATIRVANAVGFPRITIGGIGASITGQVDNGDNTTTFTIQIPTTLTLTTAPCAGAAGTVAPQATAFDVTYTSLATTCTDTLAKGIVVTPPATPTLTLTPPNFSPFSATIVPGSAGPPVVPTKVTPSSGQTVTIVNTGNAPLTITAVTQTGAGCANFSIVTPATPVSLNQCDTESIVAQYTGKTPPGTTGTDQCAVTITTNAGSKTLNLIGTTQ